MKTFTLEEAQAMLPIVESLLHRATEARDAATEVEAGLQKLSQQIYITGGMHIDVIKVAAQRASMAAHLERLKETLTEIEEIGVQLKDLDTGLLDFPCRLDDEIVLLCWRKGETSIDHWHTPEAGFAGRKPLDERFKRKNHRLN